MKKEIDFAERSYDWSSENVYLNVIMEDKLGRFIIEIPFKIYMKIKALTDNVKKRKGNVEYSIFLKYKTAEKGFIVTDYYVPKQKNTSVEVNYAEDITDFAKSEEWLIIHSHPFAKSTTFSQSDLSTISTTVPISLLINSESEFLDSTYRIKLRDGLFIIIRDAFEVNIKIEEEDVDEDFKNITEKKSYYPKTSYYAPYEKTRKIGFDYKDHILDDEYPAEFLEQKLPLKNNYKNEEWYKDFNKKKKKGGL